MAYERKWDQKTRTFTNEPLHNWASHVADAYMTFAVGYDLISGTGVYATHSTGSFDPMRYESYADFDPREERQQEVLMSGGFFR